MEISPGCSLEGLMLKLKLQYFGHLMRRANSLEKTLMLGKIEGRRRRGRQRMRWLDGITDSMDMRLGGSRSWWWTGRPGVLWFMGSQIVGHDWATELNWTETNIIIWYKPHSLWRWKMDTKLSDCPGSYNHLITSEVKNHNSHSISCLVFKTNILFLKLYCELGLPGGSDSEESACNARDLGSIPGLGRSPGEWNGYPL